MYVYLRTEQRLWTVGFYDPEGRWHSESDHDSVNEAANRVSFLNGSAAVASWNMTELTEREET